MSGSLPAADPRTNAAVMASAGTGKTWLLVTRMVRLLLAGARPEGILAITFTRKAAAEMLARLNERLRAYATMDQARLANELSAMGAPADAEHLHQARQLYERLLFAERPLRTTTFHAFCQEVLQRFPLEADIPPDFELLDTSGLVEQQAWEALYTEATRAPQSDLADALETLLERCGGLHNTQAALTSFLAHRNDWWAFTETWPDAVAGASEHLAAALAVKTDADPLRGLFDSVHAAVRECMDLLSRHDTAGNRTAVARIAAWLDCQRPDTDTYAELKLAFLRQDGGRRSRKASAAQRKSMGDRGEQRLLELHEQVCACLERTEEELARLRSLALNRAWYRAGARLIQHFQRIKREQRYLDFNDLEWRTYRLLNRADNAHWVQYKLDQRIDHLLIDEFQDTNPTQWRLLAPLLEELAAGSQERARSVFLVGDDKQSIYRFRRAEPQLLGSAAQWLEQRMAARIETLQTSWRSSPAIMQCVNAVFEGPLAGELPGFRTHATHHSELWGMVELMPLAEAPTDDPPPAFDGLRNPLLQPRPVEEDRRQQMQAQQVAARIRALVEQCTPVLDQGRSRALRYDDIYILMRKRTHAGVLEQALREAAIPYVGAGRGTLLDSLEVSDMEALLNVLTTPHDNLSLAQVLRAPIFACSDTDLLLLAERAGREPWRTALDDLAPQLPEAHPLARAQRLLSRWEAVTGRIPVHDLLDRIYHQGNVPARYEAAYPDALRVRVRANLARFISLALEVDSGRYPSLPHFIARLRKLRRHTLEAPDEPPSDGAEARVRLLTVHAAKGLEAPVVFLYDSASSAPKSRAYNALVEWPPGAAQPQQFLLTTPAGSQDPLTRQLLAREQEAEAREDRNLLYVALTRPRQYLFVSAAQPRKGDLGWYGHLRAGLETVVEAEDDGTLCLRHGKPQAAEPQAAAPPAPALAPDPRLRQPLPMLDDSPSLTPSAATESVQRAAAEADGRPRGIAVHLLLEWLSAGSAPRQALQRTAAALELPAEAPQLQRWLAEARAVLDDASLSHLFDPQQCGQAFNEMPIQYVRRGRPVSGTIDRLLVRDDEVLVVDYKTHRCSDQSEMLALTEAYAPQMRLYAQGIQHLWPRHRVRALLLFTHLRQLREVALE